MSIDLFSVILYTIVFGVVILLFHISDSGNSLIRRLSAGAAILILCSLAGFRDNSVGRDIKVYVLDYYNSFHSASSFSQALYYSRDTHLEPLYLMLMFITSRFTGDLWLILFSMQLLTVVPVYFSAKKWNMELGTSISFSMAIYVFVFYNNSFNVMRQSIACAFVLLGTTYLLFLNKNSKLDLNLKEYNHRRKEIIFVFCSYFSACLFHKTALIGIVIVLLAFMCKDKSKLFFLYIFGIVIVLYVFLQTIFAFLVQKISFSPSFLYYINIFILRREKTDWMLESYTNALYFDLLARTISILLPFLLIRKYNKYEYHIRSMTMFGYIAYCIPWLTMKTLYGNRLSMYSDFFLILLLPYLINKKFKPKDTVMIISYIILWLYWFVWIILVKWADANIYIFRF